MTKITDPIDIRVGQRLRSLRRHLGLTQSALSRMVNLTYQQIQKYENGVNRMGSGRLVQIAAVLGVPVEYFFDDCNPAQQSDSSLAAWERFRGSVEYWELNHHFTSIKDAGVRRAFTSLVKAVADDPSLLEQSGDVDHT